MNSKEIMIKFNINDHVKVKLTDLGKDIYLHQYDRINKVYSNYSKTILTPSNPKVDKDGYTDFQLWELMQLYGQHLHMGTKLPFETEIMLLPE